MVGEVWLRQVKQRRCRCEALCCAQREVKCATHFRRNFTAKQLHDAKHHFTCRKAHLVRKIPHLSLRQMWDFSWSRVRESICISPPRAGKSLLPPVFELAAPTCHRQVGSDGFDSRTWICSIKIPRRKAWHFYGAGYGNRTRLCGLGSDHSTDELTLHRGVIIADPI